VVSASTGEHIRGWSQTHGAEAEGTGRTYYSGEVPLSTTETTEGFALRDQSRGGSSTWRVTSAGGEVIGRDADNVWGDGTLASQQTLMAEVHHGVQATWDFYREELGRRGFADNGNGVRAYVDRDRHRNAFWYDGCRCLVVVDGAEGRPFSEVAVIAHEITHGVTWKTANLDYFGESGGLNESTSDIFGTMAEWHVANPVDRGDYWLGEGSEKGRRIPFVRRMDRPEADGRSVGCWRQGVGRMDVHFSSGIGNHFFYLLAEGTGAKRFAGLPHNAQSCTGADFQGIGRERAAAIWYRALTRYMVSTTGYREARDATIRAARDLYGEHSPACRAVMRTWSSVRVPQLDWQCSGKLAYGPNAVRNPGFEQGRDGWDGTWGRRGLAIVKRPAWAWRGDRFALLGGSTRPAEAWLGQRLRVPATRTAKLRSWVHVESGYYGREVHDTLRVEVTAGRRTVVLKRLTNLDADNTYQRMQLNLGRWRGERVQIRFHSVETRRDQTIWLLDGVSVTRR
jgi:hypothetical protein